MAKIDDIPQATREAILALEIETPSAQPFVTGAPLAQRRVAIVSNQGVDVCPDGFVDRWDLDGDGKLEGHELPATARIALQRRSR